LARLGELIAAGLRRTKPRTATRPTLASKTKRLDAKRVRSVVKGARKKPSAED
jgi:ribosome-associated protein